MSRKTIVEVVSAMLILLFVYAAVNKLINYHLFISQLAQSPFIYHFAHALAWLLPTIELLVVFLMIIKRTRLVGLYASLALMTSFTTYILAMLNYGHHVPCSCGGAIQGLTWKEHVIFNLFFVMLSIVGIIYQRSIKNAPIFMGQIQDKSIQLKQE